MQAKRVLIAVGGNSLIKDKNHQSVPDQMAAAAETADHIANLIAEGYEVLITHGNGPQVGFILLRSELSRAKLHPVPLEACGADTQGAIGWNIQMALDNWLSRRGIHDRMVVTLVTQTLVDRADPAFQNPNKPIGPFYSEAEALERKANEGWDVVEDAGRGWRRVVASPEPIEILEWPAIKALMDAGFIVVAAGGGGIPVIRNEQGDIVGVPAVIDKDRASAILATRVNADVFLISTAIEFVKLNFGKPNEQSLREITAAEAAQYLKEGHFKPGSMGPKVEAALTFLRNGGKRVIITLPEKIEAALKGETGTHIVP